MAFISGLYWAFQNMNVKRVFGLYYNKLTTATTFHGVPAWSWALQVYYLICPSELPYENHIFILPVRG